jgi:hypothetical protein
MATTPEPVPAKPQRRRTKAILFAVFKWLLFLAVLFFVGRAMVRQFVGMSWDETHFGIPWLVLAAASVLAARGTCFLPYGLLLRHFCRRPPWRVIMSTVWMAQIGKYLPGKVGAVAGMVWLFRRHKVSPRVSVATVFMIDSVSVIVGMMVAVPLALWWEPVRTNLPLAWLWCLILLVLGLACLHPRLFGPLCNFALRKLGQEPFESFPRVHDFLWPVMVMLAQFVLSGFGLWLMATAITDVPVSRLPLFVSASTLVGVLGLVSFFAPAGIGVQEGLLLVVLGPLIGGSEAAILAVAMRFTKTVADVIITAAGFTLVRFAPGLRRTEA